MTHESLQVHQSQKGPPILQANSEYENEEGRPRTSHNWLIQLHQSSGDGKSNNHRAFYISLFESPFFFCCGKLKAHSEIKSNNCQKLF